MILTTPGGRVRARKAVLATNAWSHRFDGLARKQVPVWTYIVLTEPLTDTQLESIGWRGREGVEDFRDLVHYYRLTADNRLLIGGRDVKLGDGVGMDFDSDEQVWAALARTCAPCSRALPTCSSAMRGAVPCRRPSTCSQRWGTRRQGRHLLVGVGGSWGVRHPPERPGDHRPGPHRESDLTDVFFVNRRIVPFPRGGLGHVTAGRIADFMRWEDRRLDVHG